MRERDETRWESERLARALFDGALDAMFLLDGDGRYVEANPAACVLFGVERAALIGRNVFEFVAESLDGPSVWRAFLTHGSMRGGYQMRRPDGGVRELEFAATVDVLPGLHLSVLRDVTERHALEAQLRNAQKMEAIGRLAGGVAHDFNNLLSVILGQTEMIRDGLDAGDPMRDDLGEVQRAGERAAELTRQLLAFSRQQVLQPQPIELGALIRSLEKALVRMLGEGITLSISDAEGVDRVLADRGQIERVVLNVAANARDAMPDGGTLTIAVANAAVGEAAGRALGLSPGAYVTLMMTDSGVGMDEATRARIFEPFFTTKGPGRGAGLGLATVFGIARQSEGSVTLDSAPGRGTTVTVYLPRTLGAAGLTALRVPAPSALRGSETVLVVIDDEPVRNLARAILRRGGYAVLEAQNGGEALLICEQHPGPIALMLSDAVMPRMSGIQLAERLARIRPAMRSLLLSGHAGNERIPVGADCIAKPITPDALLRRVRDLLDAPRR